MSVADAVAAGTFDDGQAAYDRGDHATALRLWLQLTDLGDAAAQSRIEAMYASGTGVQQDNGVAATGYRRAADQGLASAQYNFGVMYDRGRGSPQNYSAAVAWFRKAADQGDPDAQYNLGVMYAELYVKAGADGVNDEFEQTARALRGGPPATTILEGGGRTPWMDRSDL